MSEAIKAYPLAWPAGWKRTPAATRTRARFSKGERQYSSSGGGSWMRQREVTIAEGTKRVLAALRILGVEDGDAIISTNLVLRLDGLPRSGQNAPQDPGVSVYWQRGAGMKCMAIDRYDRVADNLAAVAATLEAMRLIERHGGAEVLDRAFTGFTALPAPGQTTTHWRTLFGDVGTRSELDAQYRKKRSEHHPDRGGRAEMFDMVQKAYELACQEVVS